MDEVHFPDWGEWLERAALPDRQKQSWAITVRWYLSFCRRGRAGVNHQPARDFIAWAQEAKNPAPWQLEGWREVFGKDLGDFSDYRRAPVRTHVPTWLTPADPSPQPSPHPMGRGCPCLRQAERLSAVSAQAGGRQAEGG